MFLRWLGLGVTSDAKDCGAPTFYLMWCKKLKWSYQKLQLLDIVSPSSNDNCFENEYNISEE